MAKRTAHLDSTVNPYLPSWEYIPDGEPYVFGDRVYVYGSHDKFKGEVFCLGDYVCWSAPIYDLGDWRYEGVIYKATQDPLNPDRRMVLYAPDVTVGPDGRYYLYYVLDKVSVVSVAVCDTPAGKYEFYGYVHYEDGTLLGAKEGDEPQFDPGVLTEGDTTVLFTGFCGRGDKSRHGAMRTILGPDMITIQKGPEIIVPGSCYSENTPFEGHAFFEAPSIRKRGNKYYFVYSSEVMHELCYATSDSITGEFKYGGVIISNADIGIDSYKPADMPAAFGANNHGSIIEIAGEWYIFYHRHTNRTWFSRQGCAEKITFNEDGSINQAEMTSSGMSCKPLSDTAEYNTYIVCNMMVEDAPSMYVGGPSQPFVTQDGGDGDICPAYITNFGTGSTLGFKYFDFKGITGMHVMTRGYSYGEIQVKTSWDGPVLGTIKLDSANDFRRYEADFKIPDGVSSLYLRYNGDGNCSIQSFGFKH
ncbi:MAG: family 43 glycosylhydrolase [Lachnospiraceae bacterium]|nr:family 43 glycosylhydrolase [Lachnospiraceae bacterium]